MSSNLYNIFYILLYLLANRTTHGYPKPRVQWFKKNGNDIELISHETSEVLTVARALFTPAGQYKCVVENDLGSDSAEFGSYFKNSI